MKLKSVLAVVVVMVLLSACVVPLPIAPAAQEAHDHAEHEHVADLSAEMVQIDLPISCTSEAQAEFNRGLAFLHSFWFGPAIERFNRAAELDSTCAMAHWGVAMSLRSIPWDPTPEPALAAGWEAVEQALAAGAPTPREQAYIDAVAAFYRDPETQDHHTRIQAHAAAMAELVRNYPDDTEAGIFYALALLIAAPPTDKTYANQLQAAEILEPIFMAQPNHPGVAHYLVHSYDYPSLAAKGLDAAERFAAIAPAAPHALHMPAHIFTRLGYWQESIDTNRASKQTNPTDSWHAMDYMMYGYLQLAQDEAARAVLDEVQAAEEVNVNFGSAYALAAMPARYVLERGQWTEAATLALHPSGFPWDRFPAAEAALTFARGLAAARAGDVAAARQDLERLQALHETMAATNDGYWAGQAAIQIEAIAAWIALAEGSSDEALAAMRHAVELEAATDKHPVTPGPIVPASELLGEMLLELDQPAEALVAFETSHQVEPSRFRGLYGAARAAELAGETEKARSYYAALVALAETADSERAELAAARAFLAQ